MYNLFLRVLKKSGNPKALLAIKVMDKKEQELFVEQLRSQESHFLLNT